MADNGGGLTYVFKQVLLRNIFVAPTSFKLLVKLVFKMECCVQVSPN